MVPSGHVSEDSKHLLSFIYTSFVKSNATCVFISPLFFLLKKHFSVKFLWSIPTATLFNSCVSDSKTNQQDMTYNSCNFSIVVLFMSYVPNLRLFCTFDFKDNVPAKKIQVQCQIDWIILSVASSNFRFLWVAYSRVVSSYHIFQ